MTNRVSKIVSDDSLNRIIQIESAGNPTAKASTSTATGLGQFTEQTWFGTLKAHGPERLASRVVKRGAKYVVPDGGGREILNMRKGTTRELKKFNVQMTAWHAEDNAKILGAGWGDGDLYLAHFAGVGVARKLLRGASSDRVDNGQYFSDSAINANRSILLTRTGTDAKGRPIYGKPAKSVGQVRAWAETAMRSRWDKAGRPDWVGKYWYPEVGDEDEPEPVPTPEDHPPVKVEVPAEPTPPHGRESQEIRDVQSMLKKFGYHEVGAIDGKWGGRTRAAIAAYKNDRHLEGPVTIDNELIDDIAEAAGEDPPFRRPLAPERAEASDAKVEEKVPAVKEGRLARGWAKVMTFLGLGGGGAVGVADLISDHSDDAADWWNRINEFTEKVGIDLSAIPWGWFLVFAIIGGFIWWRLRRADQKLKDAYRDGEIN